MCGPYGKKNNVISHLLQKSNRHGVIFTGVKFTIIASDREKILNFSVFDLNIAEPSATRLDLIGVSFLFALKVE